MRLMKNTCFRFGSFTFRICTMRKNWAASVSVVTSNVPVGFALASLSHTTCTCFGDEPWPRSLVATESQYGDVGWARMFAVWPPTAQSIVRTSLLRTGSALLMGTNALNSCVQLLMPIDTNTT